MFGLNAQLFFAQFINFAVVLFVLWKWVFTPVTRALQKRTAKIEASLKHAEDVEVEKAEFENWKAAEMSKVRVEAAGIVSKAKSEAETVRTELLAKAKTEHEKLLLDGRADLARESAQALQEAKGKLAELVVLATEKVLREKLTDKKDAQLAAEALKSLEAK
jgi:F-type H+-transporting ATPase subunit b